MSFFKLFFLCLSIFLFSCGPKFEFNDNPKLKPPLNQKVVPNLACGEEYKFSYKLNKEDLIGILEVENKGSCEVEIAILWDLLKNWTTTSNKGEVGNFKIAPKAPPKIFVFKIPKKKPAENLVFTIKCGGAIGDENCKPFYHFSVGGKRPKGLAPTDKNLVTVNDTDLTKAEPEIANVCETKPKVIKTFINESGEDLLLLVEAKKSQNCTCNEFIVEQNPQFGKGAKSGIYKKTGPTKVEQTAVVLIPKKKTVDLQIRCTGNSDNTSCQGEVKAYRLTTRSNRKLMPVIK